MPAPAHSASSPAGLDAEWAGAGTDLAVELVQVAWPDLVVLLDLRALLDAAAPWLARVLTAGVVGFGLRTDLARLAQALPGLAGAPARVHDGRAARAHRA